MRITFSILSTLVLLMFVSVPFAAAEWQENLVTNNTLEEIYVIKSTWQAANSNKGIPAGFWTRGSYRLDPGKSRVFYSWDTNSIYFRISNADGAIKANSGTTASAFWAHPKRSFRVVSQTFDTSVTTDQLLYSDRPNNQLAQLEGFVSYTGGSEVVVTQEWVLLDGQPTAPPNDELGDDGGRPGEDVAPPAWVASVITNATEADLYVVYATWKLENSKKGYPEGFRTRGTYRIRSGKGRVFHAWADNEIYFRIANAAGALKPEASSETFGFWLHPRRSFRLVSDQVAATVEQSGLSYSDRSVSKLERSDGFMVYESGSDVVVTSDWVPVVPVDAGNNGNGDAGDDGTPTPPTSPVIPAAPAGMVLIPAGTFQMGNDNPVREYPSWSRDDEMPAHSVSLDAFYMDTHEVTNAEFRRFVLANPQWQKGNFISNDFLNLPKDTTRYYLYHWDDDNNYPAGEGDHPITYVNWYAAMAYAAWVGKRLPTEAEWEYAARGGLAGKLYPWGDTIDASRAHYNMLGLNASLKPTGSYAANGYGLYDMAGNVWEWCLDRYLSDYYASSPARNPLAGALSVQGLLDTYTEVDVDSRRVLRGGSYWQSRYYVEVSMRGGNPPDVVFNTIGFRCAQSVSGAPTSPEPPEPPTTSVVPVNMALIPAGTFQMGSTTGDADESPVHTVSLDAFYMDTHEVTNAEYAAFLNAKGKHADAGKTWLNIADADIGIALVDGVYCAKSGYANRPVVKVTWYGAMAYAAWAGKRLPSEAEWEYAARGGLAEQLYPWGDTIDATQANYGGNTGGLTAVGSYAANGYGLYDMTGNVWEWCLDGYNDSFYAISPVHNPLSGADSETINDYVEISSPRVLRGGSYRDSAFDMRISNRGYSYPMSTGNDLGFRCVKSVSP